MNHLRTIRLQFFLMIFGICFLISLIAIFIQLDGPVTTEVWGSLGISFVGSVLCGGFATWLLKKSVQS